MRLLFLFAFLGVAVSTVTPAEANPTPPTTEKRTPESVERAARTTKNPEKIEQETRVRAGKPETVASL